MSQELIQNPTLSYERYSTFKRFLDGLSKRDKIDIDTEDLYKKLRPTYFPSSHAMGATHVKEWVTNDAIVLVISMIVHDLISRGSYKGPLNIVVEEITFNPAAKSWQLNTKGDIELFIDSTNINEVCVNTSIIPKALLLFDNITTVTLADILSDINTALQEFMLEYKPVSHKDAVLDILRDLREKVNGSNEPEELHAIIHLGSEALDKVLRQVSKDTEDKNAR